MSAYASNLSISLVRAIKRRQKRFARERVFVAQLVTISDDDPHITEKMRDVVAELHTCHLMDWRTVFDESPDKRRAACRKAGEHVAERMHEDRQGAEPARARKSRVTGALTRPPPIRTEWPVSGALYVPAQGDVDGRATVRVRMTFVGCCKISLEEGDIVYELTSAWLTLHVDAGRMDKHPDFRPSLCQAMVTLVPPTTMRQHTYLIQAREQVLFGPVLAAEADEDPDVPLVLVNRIEGDAALVTGSLSIAPECVSIDIKRSEIGSSDEKIAAMKKKFAKTVARKIGSIQLDNE